MTVLEECKRRSGNQPCVKIYAGDMRTVTGTSDCPQWCPLLKKPVDQPFEAEGRIAA